jgi:hypothetical protein
VSARKVARRGIAKPAPLADAKLFKLDAQRSALLAEAKRIGAEEDRVLARIKAKLGTDGYPVFDPSAPALRPVAKLMSVFVRKDGTISLHDLEEFNRLLEEEAIKWPEAAGRDPKVWKRASRARVRWWKQESAKIGAAHRAAGLREIARRWSAAHDRVDRLSDQIKATPATTLAGIVVKLRVFQDEARKEFGGAVPTDADFNPSILLGFSALADAERLLATVSK